MLHFVTILRTYFHNLDNLMLCYCSTFYDQLIFQVNLLYLDFCLLLSDLGYERDGHHQATATRRGPSSATPTTHELQARHAFKDFLSRSGSRPRTRSDLKPITRKSRGVGA